MLLLTGGCGPSDRPALAPVTGTVTLDAQPLASAAVIFRPSDGRASRGFTNQQGQYELIYIRDIRGAKLGNHTVTISTQRETAEEELVPAIYNRETTLSREVEDKKNVIDFDLVTPADE